MQRSTVRRVPWMFVVLISLAGLACQRSEEASDFSDLPDLNEETRVYVTTGDTRVRTGPGSQFRAIAEIPPDARVNVVGRDGDWALIVSKKGNAPGYIELSSVKRWDSETETLDPRADGRYETLTDTQVRSGPGLHYPVVADLARGTKLNAVEQDKGWLKVESKRGNKPGYVDASLTKPAAGD